MKNNIFGIVTILCIGFLSSCTKGLLDKEPLDKYSDATVWNDPNLAEAFINDQYKVLPNLQWYDKVRGITLSSISDETIHEYGYDGINDFNKGSLSPSIMTGFDTWQFDYGFIGNLNFALEKIDEVPAKTDSETDLIKRLSGEIYFLRAYCYADLLKRYGGVPLISKTFELTSDFNVQRSTYDECVTFVVTDLDMAASLLPETYTDKSLGRATKGAAMALKARVLLYAASPLWNANNNISKWQAAATAAKAVIDMPIYKLYDGLKYEKIFTENWNSEVILARTTDAKNIWSAIELCEGPNLGINPSGDYGGWNTNSPSQNIVDDFEMSNGLAITHPGSGYDPQNPYVNRDPRFYADINYDGALWYGGTIEFFDGGRNSRTNPQGVGDCSQTSYTMRKFLDTDYNYWFDPVGNGAGQAWIVIRLSEMYLNYAEASYYAGNETEARWAVNALRSRPSVNMPNVTETGTALIDKIRNERTIELCFEGHRVFDIRRWKIAEQTYPGGIMKFQGMNIKKDPVTNVKTYTVKDVEDRIFDFSKHYLFPIPKYELDKVNLVQNTGY